MRIVHTCLRYPPALGGAETYIRDIVEHTRNIAEGRDVRVLTSRMRTHGPISELDPALLVNDPPYIQRLHHEATPLVSYPRLQALQYYIGHHKPDILHGYGFWYQPADTAARYARKHNIPFILHPIYYEHDVRRKPMWQLYKKTVGAKTFALADVVVVISPYEQSLIENAGFSVKRFELIPPGINTTEFERPRISPFLKRHIQGSILLTVSRLAPGKGLEDIIQAMPEIIRHTPNAQLAIGGEDFGLRDDLESAAKKLGIENHIHFLGNLPREELIGAYQNATVFVHPSYYEAFGIVLAEAQAAGAPIVARNTSAIPFVASPQHGAKLFTSHTELTPAITAFLKDSNMRDSAKKAGKKYIEQQFSWNVITPKLRKLYDELS